MKRRREWARDASPFRCPRRLRRLEQLNGADRTLEYCIRFAATIFQEPSAHLAPISRRIKEWIAKLETFTKLKEFAENPHYQVKKQKILSDLTDDMIDMPIIDLINGYNKLPYCFTLQSCYGHFVYNGQKDAHNLDPLPTEGIIAKVEYRIAYIAFCIENSASGRELFEALKGITDSDPENIQFGCAEWFWNKQINSYALQVEPDRFKRQDTAIIDFKEALHIEKIRNTFFIRLYELLEYTK